ncbi:MAG: DUF2235 domain-containing protein [Paracoccaceae bacterium]|nr:DUF2235 domain-containing protein [Paracoccaceae bacterium]
MEPDRLGRRVLKWLRLAPRIKQSLPTRGKGPVSHVIILDGTMSTMVPGWETNAGLTYRLLQEVGYPVSVYYEAGVQFQTWRTAPAVMMGRGINRQIKRAYGYLASRYRPGDKIFLIGYSRGAYAVRSLAGVIEGVGLLKPEAATVRNVRQAYRLYQTGVPEEITQQFSKSRCHEGVEIEMVGVWDTVKALGVRLPILWRLSAPNHEFHNHRLGASIKHGFHALALDETRKVFEPVMWKGDDLGDMRVQQMWFRGAHGDIGGMLGGFMPARLLSNIPLIWMLEQMESCGIELPPNWQMRYPTKASAPSVGTWRSWGKLFLIRSSREIGKDPSERMHTSALGQGYSLSKK